MAITTGAGRVVTRRAALAVRAIVCAVLAVVVTFTPGQHTPFFGLLALGVFLLVQAAVLAAGVRATSISRAGRRLVLVRAAASAAGGAVALAMLGGGLGALLVLQSVVFLVLGVLELVGGVRRTEAADTAGDAVVVGGLQVLVGLMVGIMAPDSAFVVGVLGAWGAVVAVYLGIAAATPTRRDRRA